METLDRVSCRRALEALRAGVPNRDVVRLLSPLQARLEGAFSTLLRETEEAAEGAGKPPIGLIAAGGFGTGKSHLLEYLHHLALESRFVCSHVVLSKETPLSDPLKVLRAAVEAAVLPDRRGAALYEVASMLDAGKMSPEQAARYRELYGWAHRDAGLDPRLGASLLLFERLAAEDEDLREKLLLEWQGFAMKVSELRAGLKAVGEAENYRVGKPFKDQGFALFQFLTRLFRAAGYAGWIVLFDETELIARYSLRQRARAYANLARLLSLSKDAPAPPGFASVFAITDDYAGEVLHRRQDKLKLPDKLEALADPRLDETKRGMAQIETKALPLVPPTPVEVDVTYRRLAQLYRVAYDFAPPDVAGVIEYAGSTRMRQYVRAWINTWDLKRLYGYEAHVVAETVTVSYEEDADLEETPEAPDIFADS